MLKFLLRHIYIYLFLRQKREIMKATIYKGFTYVHCLFVVAGIEVLFFDKPKKEIVLLYDN
jgi:hypothetical protein